MYVCIYIYAYVCVALPLLLVKSKAIDRWILVPMYVCMYVCTYIFLTLFPMQSKAIDR